MSIVWSILIGFVVGLLARFLKPGNDKMGFIMTTLVGIGGAVGATYLGRALGWYQPGEPAGFLASLVGAIVLLVILAIVRKNKSTSVVR
ncbi:MAG TPA: GlsB/YeaQ/YmgE family stress response membrane protein [Xanthomonadales bacterium]|nr:GlsB/YeaQ/YmgE family stress response membrane protein [Xanthomonadales bacterium]